MKIQIDTATDSKEDIQKVIKLLAGIAGAQHAYAEHTPELPTQTTIQPDMGSFMNLFENPKPAQAEPDPIIPQVEFY